MVEWLSIKLKNVGSRFVLAGADECIAIWSSRSMTADTRKHSDQGNVKSDDLDGGIRDQKAKSMMTICFSDAKVVCIGEAEWTAETARKRRKPLTLSPCRSLP